MLYCSYIHYKDQAQYASFGVFNFTLEFEMSKCLLSLFFCLLFCHFLEKELGLAPKHRASQVTVCTGIFLFCLDMCSGCVIFD